MIYGENQVRNFHVVKATVNGGAVTANPFKVQGDFIVGKDAQGMPIDKIKIDSIREIKAVTPKTYKLKKFTVSSPTNIVAGENYVIYLDFQNFFGFGLNDRYHKFAVVHATTGMTASTFAETLKTSLEKQFKHEKYNPLTFTVESNSVVITEADYTVDEQDIMFQNLPIPLDLTISISENWGDAKTVVTEGAGADKGNGWVIADMERFFLKGRADRYGYVGFPNATPTKPYLTGAKYNGEATYSLVEISYFHQGHGVLNQNSEKHLAILVENAEGKLGQAADATALATALEGMLA